jgi:ABC-type glycerol-3-phosphate transport system permease component
MTVNMALNVTPKLLLKNIPNALIEAARMEGASNWSIYLKIVLPLLKPTVGALTIFTFLNYWND